MPPFYPLWVYPHGPKREREREREKERGREGGREGRREGGREGEGEKGEQSHKIHVHM